MSTRETLRKARPKIHSFEVNGDTIHIKALSGAGRAAYLALVKGAGETTPLAKIIALAVCEADGELSYDIDSDKDVKELSEVDGKVLETIAFEIFKVSGLTKEANEEAAKN